MAALINNMYGCCVSAKGVHGVGSGALMARAREIANKEGERLTYMRVRAGWPAALCRTPATARSQCCTACHPRPAPIRAARRRGDPASPPPPTDASGPPFASGSGR